MAGTEIIEIEGDLVRLVTRSVQYEVPLQGVLPRISTYKPLTLPTLARSQVFAHWDESNQRSKRLYVLAETAPGIKNIRKMDRRYRLAMPWTYFWFVASTASDVSRNEWSLENYYVYHALNRYIGLDSPMIVARLPNVYGNGRICWGTTGAPTDLSLADRIDSLVEGWYISTFNRDLDGETTLPHNEPNYRRWVEESVNDPNCWRNWPEWTSLPQVTVRSLLGNVTPTIEQITLPAPYIPEVGEHLTFGQWEEFMMRLPAEQRGRARIALDNLREDDPVQVPDPATLDANIGNDGGVPIDPAMETPYRRR